MSRALISGSDEMFVYHVTSNRVKPSSLLKSGEMLKSFRTFLRSTVVSFRNSSFT